MKNVKINKEQKLFVIQCGKYYSCIGFDNVDRKINALCEDLGTVRKSVRVGTMKAYKELINLRNKAFKRFKQTGKKSEAELFKPFIGNEGRRVEVVYNWDETERFKIGRSTGFIPCHIALKRSDSIGGCEVMKDSIKSFTFLD